LISFTVQPALIDRYTLPAAAPLLLWPLVVLCRLSPRWTCAATAVFVLIGLAHWIKTPVGEPGFRELSAYLASTVERDRELVVQVVNPQPAPDWLEGERLAFAYYPVSGIEIEELHVEADGVTPTNDILSDPRAMYLVVFQSDPFVILQAAGRRAEPLSFRGREYSQLPFLPYRVVKVAPRDGS
jgi:hypothetical protein